uniref:Lactase n=1 Tax=Tetraodon nigroviridis TaxID=99883 RepID=H3CU08_TETNG
MGSNISLPASPASLSMDSGWENTTIVQRFRDYADVLFRHFGSQVKFWITLNEPFIVANLGYAYESFAPGCRTFSVVSHRIVGKQYIAAHTEAWHLSNDKYRPTQHGIPRNPCKQEDVGAAQRYLQFFIGWFAHPIFSGDYPELMTTIIPKQGLAADGFSFPLT